MFVTWTILLALWAAKVHCARIVDPEIGLNYLTKLPLADLSAVEGQASGGGACDIGTRQSPIDIPTCTRESMNALRILGHSIYQSFGLVMINTGTTAQISFPEPSVTPVISGGPLSAEYTLAQAHFHWGETNTQGTEHATFGNYGALEAHFVHWKTEYTNFTEALNHEDGLAVFGIMFVIQDADNPKLDEIVNNLSNIPNPEDSVDLDGGALAWLDDVISNFYYFNYPGSLTTGTCLEVVNWIVMKKKLGISAQQVAKFRTLINADGNTQTSYRRDVQPLKSRTVKCAAGCIRNPEL
ncbi:carbonic anhydrase 2-like [Neocloeon triangulifer]|uniref:carbonic anhydrase 2-like n=1 Tax=Neocloeon triangulifer TaxID=2078957 RepID=UPI00286F257C|nr:carbonic anhydrase 2-like [Neocloeon triangulifer]